MAYLNCNTYMVQRGTIDAYVALQEVHIKPLILSIALLMAVNTHAAELSTDQQLRVNQILARKLIAIEKTIDAQTAMIARILRQSELQATYRKQDEAYQACWQACNKKWPWIQLDDDADEYDKAKQKIHEAARRTCIKPCESMPSSPGGC